MCSFFIYSDRDKLVKEMYEEIRLEKINSVKQVKEEAEAMILRKEQLQITWYVLYDNNRAFMDYQLDSKEMDAVSEFTSLIKRLINNKACNSQSTITVSVPVGSVHEMRWAARSRNRFRPKYVFVSLDSR